MAKSAARKANMGQQCTRLHNDRGLQCEKMKAKGE